MKFFTILLIFTIVWVAVTVEGMPSKHSKKHSGKLGKRDVAEFPDFDDEPENQLRDYDFDLLGSDEDEVEGDGLVKRASVTPPDHEMRKKRQLSASDAYFNFFPEPPTEPTPEWQDNEKIEKEPADPVSAIETAEVTQVATTPVVSLGITSTLDIAKLIVQRSGTLRNALITSLRHVLQDNGEEHEICADSAITAIKIQALGKANQIVTNGILNFMTFLPKIMTHTMTPNHSEQEHRVLTDTFQILATTISQARQEVEPVMHDRINEDQEVIKLLHDVQDLVVEINSQAEKLMVKTEIVSVGTGKSPV